MATRMLAQSICDRCDRPLGRIGSRLGLSAIGPTPVDLNDATERDTADALSTELCGRCKKSLALWWNRPNREDGET